MRISSLIVLTTTLIYLNSESSAQMSAKREAERRSIPAELDALAKAPRPKAQDDLNTSGLAAAHRERAESMEERTNGLWQSWLVSICEGCGPQMLSYKQRGIGQSENAADAGRMTSPAPQMRRTAVVRRDEPERLAGLSADLSPGNVGQIRRRPRP